MPMGWVVAGRSDTAGDPNAANHPDAGRAVSQDGDVAPDKDVTLSGGAANDILTGEAATT